MKILNSFSWPQRHSHLNIIKLVKKGPKTVFASLHPTSSPYFAETCLMAPKGDGTKAVLPAGTVPAM